MLLVLFKTHKIRYPNCHDLESWVTGKIVSSIYNSLLTASDVI